MNLIETCRQFIAIDSTPSNGNLEISEFIANMARELGFEVDLQEESLNGRLQANVILRPKTSSKKSEVLLLTHLDTPDPGSYGLWTKTMANPFKASIYGDQMFGLGTADAKLDFLCKMIAASEFVELPQKNPFAVVGSFGEQSNMEGAIKLIRRKRVQANMALVGKPTQLNLVSAGSGITMVEVFVPFSEEEKNYHNEHNKMESSSTQSKMFSGRSAIASDPRLGENAIMKMFEYLSNLPDGIAVMDMDGGISANTVPSTAVLEIDMVGEFKQTISKKMSKIIEVLKNVEEEFRDFPANDFDPEFSTLNVGKIRKFREGIMLSGCCNILPSVSESKAESWMSAINQACKSEGGRFRILANKKPFRAQQDSQLVQACQATSTEMNLAEKTNTTSLCTEANVLSPFGIDCVVFGPGQGAGNTHEPNERINIVDLEQAIGFYKAFIRRVCL